jgi:hypothetical protein
MCHNSYASHPLADHRELVQAAYPCWLFQITRTTNWQSFGLNDRHCDTDRVLVIYYYDMITIQLPPVHAAEKIVRKLLLEFTSWTDRFFWQLQDPCMGHSIELIFVQELQGEVSFKVWVWILDVIFIVITRHGIRTILLVVAVAGVDARCIPIMVHPMIGLQQHNLRTCRCTCTVAMCSLSPGVGAGREQYNSCVGTPTSARGLSHVAWVAAASTSVPDSYSPRFR